MGGLFLLLVVASEPRRGPSPALLNSRRRRVDELLRWIHEREHVAPSVEVIASKAKEAVRARRLCAAEAAAAAAAAATIIAAVAVPAVAAVTAVASAAVSVLQFT